MTHGLGQEHVRPLSLFVAIQLGLQDIVAQALNNLQREVNDSPALVSAGWPRTPAQPLTFNDGTPVMFHDSLREYKLHKALKTRRDELWAIESETKTTALTLFHEAFSPYYPKRGKDKTATCTTNAKRAFKETCHDAFAGSIAQQLTEHGLTPQDLWPDGQEHVRGKKCLDMLANIKVVGVQHFLERHNSCFQDAWLKDDLANIRKKFEEEVKGFDCFIVPEALQRFMDRRQEAPQ